MRPSKRKGQVGGGVEGAACAIAVSGSDVYIAGNIDFTDNYDSPVFRKNGVVSVLSSGEVTATSIGVSPSGDVYVTGNVTVVQPGEDGTTAILWKNGSQTTPYRGTRESISVTI